MLELILVANYCPDGQHVPMDNFNSLVEESYFPFLNVWEEAQWNIVHCWNGFTLRQLAKSHPEFLEKIYYIVKTERAELAIKGFSDALFSRLGNVDISRQLETAHAEEISAWSKPSTGFFSAEGWIDPWLVSSLRNTGTEWGIVSSLSLLSHYPAEYHYQVLHLPGFHKDEYLPCLPLQNDPEIIFGLLQILLGKADSKSFISQIVSKLPPKLEQPILVLPIPVELPLFSQDSNTIMQRFRSFIQFLDMAIPLKISSPKKVLSTIESNKKRCIYYDVSIYAHRLEILFNELRNLLQIAQQKNPESSYLVAAQENLLLAQDCEALQVFRNLFDKDSIFPHVFSRYTHACLRLEHAFQQVQKVLSNDVKK